MHPKFLDADRLSREAIGAAIEVHRILGPGLLESIYHKCLLQEFELRGIPGVVQEHVSIEYKGLIFLLLNILSESDDMATNSGRRMNFLIWDFDGTLAERTEAS